MLGSYCVIVCENDQNIVSIPCTEEAIACLVQKNLVSLFPKAKVLIETTASPFQSDRDSCHLSAPQDLSISMIHEPKTQTQAVIDYEAA